MKCRFTYLFFVLLGAILPDLAFAQATPPQIIVTFGAGANAIPLAHVPLLAALGIILMVLVAGYMGKLRGKLRGTGLFMSITASLVLVGAGLFYFEAVRAQIAQRTLELVNSPAVLQISGSQNDNILVRNKTGQTITLRSISIGNNSANEYSIASPGTTCTSGVQLENDAACAIQVAYTAGGNGGNGGNSDFIDNPQTPDDFIERTEAIANGDPRIPLSTQEELEEAFKSEKDPEVVARKSRLQQNHNLVLAAVDPDPTWHRTDASTDFIVAEPGNNYTVDLSKVDPEGNNLGALKKTDQEKLRFEVRVQENETTVNYVPSHSHKDYIRWNDSTPGRLHINVPADLRQGRLLIGIRPKFKDKGQAAIAERWSTPVVLEIWPKRTGVTTIGAGNIYYPTEFREDIAPRQGSVFTIAEMMSHLEQAYADFPDEPILKPLLVSGVNLTAGQLIDVRIPRPEGGMYPYGGRVVRVIDGTNGQQLAVLNFDLASVYELLESDPLINEGVMPEFVSYRVGNEIEVSAEGEPELEYFGPEERSGIKSQQKMVGQVLINKADMQVKCEGDADSASAVFTPIFMISPEIDVGIEFTLAARGVRVNCALTLDGAIDISSAFKTNPLIRFASIFGVKLSAGPYAQSKISWEPKSNAARPSFFETTWRYTKNEGLSTPQTSRGSGAPSTRNGLEDTPFGLETSVGASAGLGVALRVEPKPIFGGKLDTVLGLESKVGLGMGVSDNSLNAAAVKQWDQSSSADFGIKYDANLRFLGGAEAFIGYLSWLGIKIGPSMDFGDGNVLDIQAKQAIYEVAQVQDSGRGEGSVSFNQLSMPFPLKGFFIGPASGYAALEGSTVYNDPTDNITYALSECKNEGGTISTPLIVCTGDSFCGKANKNADFCKGVWIEPLMATAYVGETASTEGTVGTAGSETVQVNVSGSPLQPQTTSFNLSASSEQTFLANVACTERGVTTGKIQAIVGGKVVDEQTNILTCNCEPGAKDCDRVWGDPYMVTADGMAYTYLATGNYILARVHDAQEQPVHGLEVQANFLPGFGAAWLYSTAMQVGNDVVEFRPAILGHDIYSVGLEVMINGDYLYTPAKNGTGGSWPETSRRLVQLPGGGLLYVDAFVEQYWTYKPRSLTVIWPQDGPFDGYAVNVSVLDGQFREPEPFVELQFTRPDRLAGRERGLLGNNDGNPNNDFIRRNGQVLAQDTPLSSTALYALFGGDWLVKPRECLFADGCATEPIFATQPVELTPEQRALGEIACAGLTGFYREACINDVGLTGSTDLVREYYANTDDLNDMANRVVTPGVDIAVYQLSAGAKTNLPEYQGEGFRQSYQVTHQVGEGKFLLTIRPPRGGSAFFSEGSEGALKQSITATGNLNTSVDVQCDNPDPNWAPLGDAWAYAGAVQLWAVDPLSGFAKQLLAEKRLVCFQQENNNRIAAGEVHTLFLDNEGQIWAWGDNRFGQLGDGSTTNRHNPVQVDLTPLNGSTVRSISAGAHFSMALDDQGRMWAWGDNKHGQLGNGGNNPKATPTLVDLTGLNGRTIQAFWKGGIHTIALDDQGHLWAWGANYDGQLGDGSTTNRHSPVQVDLTPLNGSTIRSVSAGAYHTLALDDQGHLWAWGANYDGQLGDGSTTNRHNPVQVDLTSLNGSTVVAISAGGQHNLALDDQGRLWAWGVGENGRLGDGSKISYRNKPVEVDLTGLNGSAVQVVLASFSYNLALDDQSRLWAWGYNYSGQLGNGNNVDQTRPVLVDLSPFNGAVPQTIWGGNFHTLALDDQGRLWAWGYNSYGQLGDGTTIGRSKPVQVDMSAMKSNKEKEKESLLEQVKRFLFKR